MRRLLSACCAVTCTALFVACGSGPKDSAPVAAAKTWTRDEFKKLVEGKTEKEVLEAVGKPDNTSESGDDKYWYYKGVSTDPVTGKVDRDAQIVFKNGKVVAVNF